MIEKNKDQKKSGVFDRYDGGVNTLNLEYFEKMLDEEGIKFTKMTTAQARNLLSSKLGKETLLECVLEDRYSRQED